MGAEYLVLQISGCFQHQQPSVAILLQSSRSSGCPWCLWIGDSVLWQRQWLHQEGYFINNKSNLDCIIYMILNRTVQPGSELQLHACLAVTLLVLGLLAGAELRGKLPPVRRVPVQQRRSPQPGQQSRPGLRSWRWAGRDKQDYPSALA